MKIISEFVVLHDDVPMPDEEAFCPSFWKAEDGDSDGDYYLDGLDGRWNELRLTKRVPGGGASSLWVLALRDTPDLPPALRASHELRRFLDLRAAGEYDDLAVPSPGVDVAVSALEIETADLDDYREFLATVDMYLGHTGGVLISPRTRDRDAFAAEFLTD